MKAVKSFVIQTMRDDEWVFTGQPFTGSLWIGADEKVKFGEVDEANKNSVKGFGYYNKDVTDATVDLYNSYYIFAEYKDLYVPVRPMARTKVLIAIKQKYFDAVPFIDNELDLNSDPFIENANFIISIPFKDFESEMIKLSDVLKLYNFDVLVSNSKVGFRFGTKENELYNTSEDIINELSLSEKADKIIDFHSLVLSHLNENSFPLYTERQLNNVKIEFN
jgi:hypothetical protein